MNFKRLIVEGLLIFGSVYGAFLLEDRRSKKFEREVLRDKLIAHLKVMKLDSITFDQRLGSSETKANIGLIKSIENHKMVLAYLKKGAKSDLMEAYQIHRNNELFWRIIQSATKSEHQLENILENYEHLLLNDSTLFYMKQYIYHTWVINQFASWADEQIDEVENYGFDNYFVLTSNEKEEDILAYVSQPIYFNGIKLHLDWIEALKKFKRDYDEDFKRIRSAIIREIEAQNELL